MLKKDDDNQMWKTGNSFNKAKVTGQESTTYKDIDNFHTMEQLKQQENAYMATNPTIILKHGHFDETQTSFIQFKR